MPPPKKLDLIPDELREQLKAMIVDRGFGDIIEITDELNTWLAAEGLTITIGKSAVGQFSKMLKVQRDAFSMAETLLADMDIDAEADIQRALVQMIAASAMQMMMAMTENGIQMDAQQHAFLAKMLKDLMTSSGIREKILADERDRIAKAAKEEAVEDIVKSSNELGLSTAVVEQIRSQVLGVDSGRA
jgi:hypothetical protein